MRALTVTALLGAVVLSGSVALLACAANEEDSADSDSALSESALGDLGDDCNAAKGCLAGLVCKPVTYRPPTYVGMPRPPSRDSGAATADAGGDEAPAPEPGRVGMPAPTTDASAATPPPGMVGMPRPPTGQGVCQHPDADDDASAPPGMVGMPRPPRGGED